MMYQAQSCIAHLDLDAFFVSVEQILDPTLVGKPVIVGGNSQRGVVCAASYEARKFGVKSAMPTAQAHKLCPHAIFLSGSSGQYSRFSHQVTEIIQAESPEFEKASIDEFYIDLTGMDKYHNAFNFTHQLKSKIKKEIGLNISFAIAANKLVSKVATNEVKPNGEIEIPFGFEKSYLAPMPLEKLPGVGDSFIEQLHKRRLYKIGEVADLKIEQLENIWGKNGADLWLKCNGIGSTRIATFREQKSCSSEHTFHEDKSNETDILTEITKLSERVGYDLRSENKMTGCIAIKIKYYNFNVVSKQTIVSYTASDTNIIHTAKQLFNALWDKTTPIRLIGVRCSHFVESNFQLNIFDNIEQENNLYKAIDNIKNSFGKSAIKRAGSLKPKDGTQ
ncbi:DNA polymerase IV [Polluticaenibacter yanchengensis]|uniref:DNA polymerase IV n=1 Tax=Polluticaenibacter yanchengensis TaxID=3014562 RepID=A0ABT4URB8_9BACT|nr:DNA polymerase IV [Chitinophagaceae bacterium LY-5]